MGLVVICRVPGAMVPSASGAFVTPGCRGYGRENTRLQLVGGRQPEWSGAAALVCETPGPLPGTAGRSRAVPRRGVSAMGGPAGTGGVCGAGAGLGVAALRCSDGDRDRSSGRCTRLAALRAPAALSGRNLAVWPLCCLCSSPFASIMWTLQSRLVYYCCCSR